MQHFNKNIAYFSMDNAIHSFKYPTSLANIDEANIVPIEDLFPYPQSTSFQTFLSLRKQIVKTPLYILENKPSLVKRYLIAVERFYHYLKKVQKKEGITNNSLVNNLFLVDTIIDPKNEKIIFTNYSIIALLLNYISKQKNDKNKAHVVKFINKENKENDVDFVFFDDTSKFKLTKLYSDRYIFGIGIKV